MLQTILAIFLGKIILIVCRTFKIGGGSAAPGHYTLRLEPNLVSKLASQIPTNIIITGTNGKTTTARILNHLVKQQNIKTLRNSTGSNLERGIASALIGKSNFLGKIQDIDLGIWELDEAAFNKVVFQIKPKIIVFLNAFRDQLDRYGEVDSVVKKWFESLEKIDWDPIVMVNGDDVNTARLAKYKGLKVRTFGIKNADRIGELGLNKEVKSGLDIEAKDVRIKGLKGLSFSLSIFNSKLAINLPVPGVYHIYDFLAAVACYYTLNLDLGKVNNNLRNYSPAFGRVEKIKITPPGCEVFIFLIKNPAGASLVFKTVGPQIKAGDHLLLALNDNFADGTDVSWIWDGEFEKLKVKSDKLKVICSGTRVYDLALRLKYAGVESGLIQIEPNLEKALVKSLDGLDGRLFVLPTYTALLELQKVLAKRGHKKHYWKEEG